MPKEEIIAWLNTLPDGSLIAIDDGGLTLVVPGSDAYLEIGGWSQ